MLLETRMIAVANLYRLSQQKHLQLPGLYTPCVARKLDKLLVCKFVNCLQGGGTPIHYVLRSSS